MKILKLRALDGDGVMVYDVENPFDYIRKNYLVMEFTNYLDCEKQDIYEDDLLEDVENIYHVRWNSCQACWWLEPIKNKINGWDLIFITSNQKLGNGYLSRSDMKKIGNIHENPELIL